MTNTLHSSSPTLRIEVLLSSMAGERHARCSMAHELCAELERMAPKCEAARLARELADQLAFGPMLDYEYELRLARMSTAVAAMTPGSPQPATTHAA